VQTKEESWSYATPQIGKVATVGIGVDGTCMLICDQKWREAMTGSISLYDKHGERLHTIYLGAAPEYGKETFFSRMQREIGHVKLLYPKRVSSALRMAQNPIGIFLAPISMSRCWISTTPLSIWRAPHPRFAAMKRIVSNGLMNNVTISSTSIMRQRGFCATWSKSSPRK
jgi:hypothetical protein